MSGVTNSRTRRIRVLASDPATGREGDTYWNSATDKLRVHNGSAWADAVPAGATISGLTTGQYVKAASATTIQTDGVKRYVARLSQTGTNAPVATVLENSLGGTPVFTYDSTGIYVVTLSGAFPTAKTVVFASGYEEGNPGPVLFGHLPLDANSFRLRDFFAAAGDIGDEWIGEIIILVYP